MSAPSSPHTTTTTPLPVFVESDNDHEANVEAMKRLSDRITARLSDERATQPTSPHERLKDPEGIYLRQFVKRGARGGLTGQRTHQAYVLYPVADATPIPGHLDYGLLLVTRHVSGQHDLTANLYLYARSSDGAIRCKKEPSLRVATADIGKVFSAAALADFILAAVTNVSVSPMMNMMLESRDMIAELDRIRAAGRLTF